MFLYVLSVCHGLYLLCIIHAGVLGLIRKEVPASHNESELLSLPNDCEKGKQDGDDGLFHVYVCFYSPKISLSFVFSSSMRRPRARIVPSGEKKDCFCMS